MSEQDVWGKSLPIRLPPIGGEALLNELTLDWHRYMVFRREERKILVYADLAEVLGYDKQEYIGCLELAMTADGRLEVTLRLHDENYRLQFLRVRGTVEKVAAHFDAVVDRWVA